VELAYVATPLSKIHYSTCETLLEGFGLWPQLAHIFHQSSTQGCDSRTRGNHARGLKNLLHAVFTRYLRGNHVRYIYGIVLKYTVNTGELVFFLVVGGRRVFKFCVCVCCACLSLYSLFLISRPFIPPCACAFSCSAHRHGPFFCAYRQVRNVTENFEYIP